MNFKVGDKVTAYGCEGIVSRVIEREPWAASLQVEVMFVRDGFSQWFISDGRADLKHNKPVLELVKPPKKLVDRKLYVAVQTAPDRASLRGAHQVSMAYQNKRDAEGAFLTEHQVCELEIKVEE